MWKDFCLGGNESRAYRNKCKNQLGNFTSAPDIFWLFIMKWTKKSDTGKYVWIFNKSYICTKF